MEALEQYLETYKQIIKGLGEAKNYIDLDLNEQTKKHLATLIMRELDIMNEQEKKFYLS